MKGLKWNSVIIYLGSSKWQLLFKYYILVCILIIGPYQCIHAKLNDNKPNIKSEKIFEKKNCEVKSRFEYKMYLVTEVHINCVCMLEFSFYNAITRLQCIVLLPSSTFYFSKCSLSSSSNCSKIIISNDSTCERTKNM